MRPALMLCTGALLWLPLIAGCPPGDDDDDGNWPPTATSVFIEPAAPEAGEALTVFLTAEAWDADGDEVTYRIAWTLDGVLQEAWTSPTIDPGVTSDGQTWRVMVTPTDGHLDGPASSDSVVVDAAMGDDDTGDDDTGDDDTGDDDAGDDDTEWPAPPYATYQDAMFHATGGPAGGPADVVMTWNIVDQNFDEICGIEWTFDSTYTHGPAQGPDLYQYIDETLVWDSGVETHNTCPLPFEAVYGADPWTIWAWRYHPMAFVSCDLVNDVDALSDSWLADDVFGLGIGGTFSAWCNEGGPALQNATGTGPMEGIWLMGGQEGLLDGVGNYGYFHPDDQSNVEAWMLLGTVMADSTNLAEPTEGLEGLYQTVPIWMWLF